MDNKNLGSMYTHAFKEYWDLPCFSDYEGEEFKYSDVAQSIETLKNAFKKAGLKKGDKVAILGRNSSKWGKIFLACVSYGVIAVPILPDFKPENVHHIIKHSESKFLFVAKALYNTLNKKEISDLQGCIAIEDFSILECKNDELKEIIKEGMLSMKGTKVKKENFHFIETPEDDLQVLSYTSGSSGFSKGVMIPVRSLYSNITYGQEHIPLASGDKIVSFLPMSHVFGLLFEFLYPITLGCHTTFLNKTPSPQVLIAAFQKIRPRLILSVPLIIEKIYKNKLLPTLQKPIMKVLLKIPGINTILYKKIRAKLIETFGGNFIEIVIGGAALNAEVEKFFKKINFPFTIGYGMTECGPLIGYAGWQEIRPLSAGKLVDRMEIRIDSEDPFKTVGEIQVKGTNVMLGYFKNEEANRNTFTDDGWMKTGDLGIIDEDNFIYIKGRSKNMLLGPSGQNIYPEELEARLSNMSYIMECVVVQRDHKLVALVYPDKDALKLEVILNEALPAIMEENKRLFNQQVPAFEQLTKIEIVSEEFEKTPKRNIKRYLYT
ncbi:MAG: AMP-binding protein [Prolixibacteraceae bacterium]|jgi:long-chain acyl-CoA synthetase|nr:AMP-binding protein [Prolixibacteraceae bacterium]